MSFTKAIFWTITLLGVARQSLDTKANMQEKSLVSTPSLEAFI